MDMAKKKEPYYSLENILKRNAHYNIIFGERSNGKGYSVMKKGLIEYFKTGHQLAIIRRWAEDFKGANSAKTCYDTLMCNGEGLNDIAIISEGKYVGVEYYAGDYYLCELAEDGQTMKRTDRIIARAFALTQEQHYKSGSWPLITSVLLDEFITRDGYLPNEFIKFTSVLSSIIRGRNNVTIYMCGNTVNKYGCPYFTEMGIYNLSHMHKGDIDVYTYGESGLTVAVEYADSPSKTGKKSDIYFAFNNPKLKMITEGAWELEIYPHLDIKYLPKHIALIYFIIYSGHTLQCEIVYMDGMAFTYIHRKTSPLKDADHDIIYQIDPDPRINYRPRLQHPITKLDKKISSFFADKKVFYQDNEIGEIVRAFLEEGDRQ